SNTCHNLDIFQLLEQDLDYDLAYYDPPYGRSNNKMPSSRVRYNAYYHIWKSVVLNDKADTFGKCNRREDSRDKNNWSVFEDYRKNENGVYVVSEALSKLIDMTNCETIIFSYSSGGRSTKKELIDILNEKGEIISFIDIDYKRNVMSG